MSKNNFLGGIRPVAQRELREGARRPFNYWLRVGAGAAGILMVVYVTQIQARNVRENMMGLVLLSWLHFLLMGLICLMAPCMTADCIAREKREGTLGLLFLTPLTAGGIVAGKGLAQGLRALTLWVSVAPALTIPFVMGGVGWAGASAALALEFSALVLCMAAGLLASTLVKGRGAALVLALFLGGGLVGVFCWLAFRLFLARIPSGTSYWDEINSMDGFNILLSGLPLDSSPAILRSAPVLPGNNFVFFGSVFGAATSPKAIAAAIHLWNQILWGSPIAALAAFALALRFAAWRMARSWRDKIPSRRQESLLRTYCRPVFRRWSARGTRRKLDRNPIAWLQQYSWKVRVRKWVLCLVFVVAAAVLVSVNRDDYSDFGATTALLFLLTIAAGMTFAGINSFAEEKQSGALELILVTPIPVNQIIFGRVLGVWKQFLPAALILAFFDAARLSISGELKFDRLLDSRIFDFLRDFFPERLLVVCGFLTLPVFALYFTLRLKNSIVAAVLTWAALLLPFVSVIPLVRAMCGGQLVYFLDIGENIPGTQVAWMSVEWALTNLAMAAAAFFLLRRRLSRRLYSF
jgi:ABC-type transport system involved in multi-copper enzyme maturation permease subunit